MAKLQWDNTGERFYETGTKNGVLWVMNVRDPENGTLSYNKGVAWNGLTAITESPSGAEETALYADDIKYLSLRSTEEFGCTIEAYTYPDEFMECDGSEMPATGVVIGQQKRATFAFSYKTVVGNDTEGNNFGYKIHLIYGCTASPSERSYTSINESPEGVTFSWEVTTIPVNVEGFKPTALITIDSTKLKTDAGKGALAVLERIIYGGTGTDMDIPAKLLEELKKVDPDNYDSETKFTELKEDSQLVMPDQIIKLFKIASGQAAAG